MNARTKIIGFGILTICGAAIMLSERRSTPVVSTTPRQEVPAPTPLAQAPRVSIEPSLPDAPVKELPMQSAPKPKPAPAQNKTLTPNATPPKEPLRDPDAREALALVGFDPEAEQYWLEAIYDSSLPDNEREDLMEDLNEVGFNDPKNLTADDLPLILNRLALIRQIGPNTDPFMAEHLGEAYKDLSNMADRVAER